MPKRMKSIDGDFFIPSRHRYGRFKTDPTDHSEDVNVHEVVADIFTIGIGFVVPGSDMRTYIAVSVFLPGLSFQQYFPEFRRDGKRNFLAGLELLNPDSVNVQIDLAPTQQNAVFHTLTGKHSEVVDDPHLVFVHDLVFVIGKHISQLLFLFTAERQSVDILFPFLAFLPQKDC